MKKLKSLEIKGYLNSISEEIFRKPLGVLDKNEIATLKANLIVRLRLKKGNMKLSDDEYEQLLGGLMEERQSAPWRN